nr:hypothetical protein [uncultured Flavobacterium sp.]
MEHPIQVITDFISQFTETYTPSVIEEDVVAFYNDAFLLIHHFYEVKDRSTEIEEIYKQLLDHIIAHQHFFKDYETFDFNTISTLTHLDSNIDFKKLNPIFTPYSFKETEETIEQIIEEMKTVKDFHKELKEEINYLLDEYQFHLEHLKENMQYHFYTYEELEHLKVEEIDVAIEDLKEEKLKFIQKCTDKLAKKK